MRNALILPLFALSLAACTTTEDPWLAGLPAGGVQAGAADREVGTEQAMAQLIGLGKTPIAVRQLTTADGMAQQIVYANDTLVSGENILTVEPVSTGASTRAPTKAALSSDIRRAIPGVAMDLTPELRSNAYGPYGVAKGSLPGGGSCIYAWQIIDKAAQSSLRGTKALSVTLRYCDPKAHAQDLASLLASLTVGPGAAAPYSPTPLLSQPARLPETSTRYAYSAPDKAMSEAAQEPPPTETDKRNVTVPTDTVAPSAKAATVAIPLPE